MTENGPDSLLILWTSGDREVAIEMVFIYALNSKVNEWWKNVELCIWGPSAMLAVDDDEIIVRLTHMIDKGVKVTACKACADNFDVTGKLEDMGVDVKYMGVPLTEKLKSETKVLTF